MLQLPTSSFLKYHHTHTSQNGCDAEEKKELYANAWIWKRQIVNCAVIIHPPEVLIHSQSVSSQCVVTGYKSMLFTDENLREHS